MVLSTLVHYFGSEVCFGTNVPTHTYCALVAIMKHDLDSFCMKLK